jgi:hypothetical protein
MEEALPLLLFFDPAGSTVRRPGTAAALEETPEREKRLFCTACRHPVTHQDERIQVHGGHEHRFTNPHGIPFHIGCFREAAGCLAVGAATPEFTWFAGYAWRIALCAHCRAHLGWRFEAPQDYFYGLIIARLTSAGPPKIP